MNPSYAIKCGQEIHVRIVWFHLARKYGISWKNHAKSKFYQEYPGFAVVKNINIGEFPKFLIKPGLCALFPNLAQDQCFTYVYMYKRFKLSLSSLAVHNI